MDRTSFDDKRIPFGTNSQWKQFFVEAILRAILENDTALLKMLIRLEPVLVNHRVETAKLYETLLFHWLYVGDCALHLAAVGYRTEIANALISAGADPDSALNHRDVSGRWCEHVDYGRKREIYYGRKREICARMRRERQCHRHALLMDERT